MFHPTLLYSVGHFLPAVRYISCATYFRSFIKITTYIIYSEDCKRVLVWVKDTRSSLMIRDSSEKLDRSQHTDTSEANLYPILFFLDPQTKFFGANPPKMEINGNMII